MRCTQTQRDA